MNDFTTNFSVVDQADKNQKEYRNNEYIWFNGHTEHSTPKLQKHIFQWNICDHILIYKGSLNKFQKNGIIHIAFFDHIGIK